MTQYNAEGMIIDPVLHPVRPTRPDGTFSDEPERHYCRRIEEVIIMVSVPSCPYRAPLHRTPRPDFLK